MPPFGWEDICSHRPLRALARSLASQGIPTFRFDLPGTGDSSGSALDHDLFRAWIAAVKDAAAEFVETTRVQTVSVLGIRLGAMLGLAAVSEGLAVDNLVLWHASANGRALLRELRVFHTFESKEGAPAGIQPSPISGLEVAGFLLNPETERALGSFSAADLAPMPGQKVLLLSRDDLPHDAQLIGSLEHAGCEVAMKPGVGYQAMMTIPDETFSLAVTNEIVRCLQISQTPAHAASLRESRADDRSTCLLHSEVIESVCRIPSREGALFGLVTVPVNSSAKSDWCLMFLNAGAVRHVGPNRMWVEAARRWAAQGIPSVRLDFLGLGESEGHNPLTAASMHGEDLVKQLNLVLDAIRSQAECRRFLAIGLCSGAYAAFQGALQNPLIQGAIALNPEHLFWDPAVDRRRLKQRIGRGLRDRSEWLRLAREKIQPGYFKRLARSVFGQNRVSDLRSNGKTRSAAEAIAEASDILQARGSEATLVFADGEPLLREMTQQRLLPLPNELSIRCIKAGNVGHTFRQLWAQQYAHVFLDQEISQIIHRDLCSEHQRALSSQSDAVAV